MTNISFIASRLRYKRRIVAFSIAVSYMVMIIAVAVASGFRYEVRDALSRTVGDIQLSPSGLSLFDEARPVDANPSYLPLLREVKGVESVTPVVYRAGIVKVGDNIHGVMVKGVETGDTATLAVSIPRRLSEIGGIGVGDKMLTYFVGEKIRARNFQVASIYDPMIEADDRLVVYAGIEDMRRLNNWTEGQASMLEIVMDPDFRSEEQIRRATDEIGFIVYSQTDDEQTGVYASSVTSRYPQLFDWLDLLDFNVVFVLVLMMIVAGFNMISGLLITLFENISTIGTFKAMGMTDRMISRIFLRTSADLVLKGMLAGNVIAVLLCMLQKHLHILKLDPSNYFVSFVPINLKFTDLLVVDAVSFCVIMLLLFIPCAFISKVDPAETIRMS